MNDHIQRRLRTSATPPFRSAQKPASACSSRSGTSVGPSASRNAALTTNVPASTAIAEVRKRRWMWSFMPAFTAYHLLALPGVLTLGPVISATELNGASSWAAIATCFGIGTILGGILSLHIHPDRPMFVCALCFIAAAAQPLILAYAGSTAAIAALELLAGIAVTAGFTQWDTTLGREIPPHALSRVTSLDWFTTVGAMPLGFAGVAVVAGAIGTKTALTLSGVIVMALCLACLATGDVRRLRRNTDPPEPVLAS